MTRRAAQEYFGDVLLSQVAVESIKEVWDWSQDPFAGRWFMLDGDWDSSRRMISPHSTVEDLFVRGIRYQDTEQYTTMMKNMERGCFAGSYWCETAEEVDAYFERLIAAYRDIRDHGYRTQMELGNSGDDEIKVMLDRKGSMLQGPGGNHRLAIARLLGIETVPVLVYAIHYEWARSCVFRHGRSFIRAVRKGLMDLNKSDPAADRRAMR